jgi:molybdenum cofactor cytidylyltransferase
MTNSTTAVLILAAGNSSRLGLPKQLLQHQQKSLLRQIAEKALSLQPAAVAVVLGFESGRMRHELDDLPVLIVMNSIWHEGVASSIRAGIRSLPETIDCALITLCDQPFVTSGLLGQLIASCTADHPIVATAYEQTLGVPACFSRTLFPELLDLKGDAGAKRVIEQNRASVTSIPFPPASIDIDTLDDYRKHVLSGS